MPNYQHVCSTLFSKQAEVTLFSRRTTHQKEKVCATHKPPCPPTTPHNKSILKIYILALLIILSTLSYGQNIVGKIVDKNKNPLEFVTVILKRDTTIIQTVISDSNGIFIIKPQANNLNNNFSFSLIGFVKFDTTLNLSANTSINIILENDNTQLNNVIVTSRKLIIERKIDRIIFNVENSIASKGGDALDALKAAPTIAIQNNQITMIGKSYLNLSVNNINIPLTGEELINFLKTISSDDIKNIEIISNPSAKYDADGNSGIVNINLKKGRKKTWNTTLRTSLTQSTYLSNTEGASFDYNKEKVSIFSSINFSNGSIKRLEDEVFYYPTQSWTTAYHKRPYTNISSGRIGFDYDISKKVSTGIQYLGSYNKPTMDENDRIDIVNNNTSKLDSFVNSNNKSNKKIGTTSLNWHGTIKFDSSRKKLELNIDYFNYNNQINRNFNSQTFFANNTPTNNSQFATLYNGEQLIKNLSYKIDYEFQFKKINFSCGVKSSNSLTNNNIATYNILNGVQVYDPSQSNLFKYKENTQAAYISANKQINERWSFQAGLRAENTQATGNAITLNQTNKTKTLSIFPTIYISYTPNQNHSFNIDFGRRIDRPSFIDINPFKFYSSQYSYTEGNPFLLPMFGNMLTLTHTYKNKLSTALYYSLEKNGYDQIPLINPTNNTQYFTTKNYYTAQGMGVIETYTFNKLKWLETNLFGIFWYGITSFTKETNLVNNNGLGLFVSCNNSIIVDKKRNIKGLINFDYSSPKNDLVYQKKSYGNLDIGFSLPIYKEKINITVLSNDILKTNKRQQNTNTNQTIQNYSYYNDTRIIRLSISYKFGNNKLNVTKKDFGNESERGRTE